MKWWKFYSQNDNLQNWLGSSLSLSPWPAWPKLFLFIYKPEWIIAANLGLVIGSFVDVKGFVTLTLRYAGTGWINVIDENVLVALKARRLVHLRKAPDIINKVHKWHESKWNHLHDHKNPIISAFIRLLKPPCKQNNVIYFSRCQLNYHGNLRQLK